MSSKIDFKALGECLLSLDCCRICVLRYLKPSIDDFNFVDIALEKKGLSLTSTDEHEVKKKKSNLCPLCFGLFEFPDEVVAKVMNDKKLQQYEISKFLTSFSLPVLLDLAQLQMWLALIEKFPKSIFSDELPDFPIKDVLKTILNDRLSSELHKEFHQDGMMVNIFFTLDNEKEMFDKLEEVAPELFKERNKQKKRFRTEIVSRNYFEKNFIPQNINVEKFKRKLPIPPISPLNGVRLHEITFTGPTVFIAGRYNKFSRELSQTPWILNGKRMSEGSVQEIIVQQVAPYFKVPADSITFMSSGREDVDVRCLGRGRPFVLEIMNSSKSILDQACAAKMEQEVLKSCFVSIRDLQMVRRDELHYIKSGEEDKKKIYRALCTITDDVTVELLEKLFIEKEFEIQQWTPLRVLHRRTLMRRPRTIYSVKAHAVKGKSKLVVLDIVTQAGTYVKELVHGEFGRTEPSIASMLNIEIDIVALDVMNIDLNFPKPKINFFPICENPLTK